MRLKLRTSLVLATLLLSCINAAAVAEPYYKQQPLFSTAPDPTKSLNTIARFGPVGMGIDLVQPAFVMKIHNIEEGSPAATTGKLKAGQTIESINGQKLADIDPRIQLGRILAKAEASDGVIKFAIKGMGQPITVKIPILGAYSPTWPLKCAKSDKIVRQAADYIARGKENSGLANIGMLFLLSTGDKKDLEVVRNWARKAPAHTYAWYLGYGGIPLTECYLRTGDKEILANIQKWVDNAAKGQYLGAWPGRSGTLTNYGGGHLNAAGTHVLTFLLLAKECGANVPDDTLQSALRHFYRYAGRGNNPYGDDRPYTGFVDNGKNGLLAFSMAAAASLTPDGEKSIYAQARDSCAMKSFYTTTYMLHGHTGGGIGEIWRSAAMGLLHETKPNQYRDFMDSRQWHYDMSRRFNGSFGILGGGGYDTEKWGVAYPLAYTIPRKTLRIAGAPRTKFSKSYQLPKRPWGNDADDIFMSIQAVPDKNGKKQDMSGETIAKDASMHFLTRFHGKQQPSDDEIRKYIYHPEFNIRNIAACKALGLNPGYIGKRVSGGKVRMHLVMEFLQHKDPRVRRAMFTAMLSQTNAITPEIYALAVKALKTPAESWMVKDAALLLIARGSADQIAPLIDLLIPYLKHEEAWLKRSALDALTPVVADTRCYKKVIPAIGDLLRSNQRGSITVGLAPAIRAQFKNASPDVQTLARKTLHESFTGYAGKKHTPKGHNITRTYDWHLEGIAASLVDVPGGYDVLYEIARKRYPDQILPYKEIFLAADSSKFGPKLKKAITPIIMNELVPEYVGKNRKRLTPLAASELKTQRPGGKGDAIDGLSALYKRAGHGEYDWHMFADLRNAEWSYHTFDPIPAEQVPFDQLVSRYRDVTMPKGMENWHAADFDPAKAGWKKAKSPFGNYDGKIPNRPITKCSTACVGPGCYGSTKINTLWEKEVLLMHGEFKIPPLKAGHRYRLRTNTGDHVGAGGGHLIYINGKPLVEAKQGGGRGSGQQPKGAFITKEFLDDFKSGKVTIAVKTFIRYNAKYSTKPSSRTPQGKISIHIGEQKIPPMGDDLVFKSASIVPMMSSDWQAKYDPEDNTQNPDDNLFRWDGKFVANPKIAGKWRLIAQVAKFNEFDPNKRLVRLRNPPFSTITFKDGGKTDHRLWAWSGDMLMGLERFEARKMQVRKVGKAEYLFVESDEFSTRHKPGWKSKLYVLTKAPLLVMLGDSVIDRGMPTYVKKRLDKLSTAKLQAPIVINAGRGGDNATSALDRLKNDVLRHQPDIVTVSFGLNDTGGRKPDQFKASLIEMIKRLKDAKIKIILMTSTPFNNERHGWGKQFKDLGGLDEYMDKEFCAKMRSLADGKDVLLCDLHAIFKAQIKKNPDLINKVISSDGVHLTNEGYVLAAEHVTAEILKFIAPKQ
ncbi:MAG: hypothetical protein HN350_17565 [Phycisphaerales bacterium]|jgi:lysophospholipase L1-like esterase|nr:hypothetical protein [Phycisphaerales bacterium]